jgi:lipopolysaccharide transport system permease protein
MDSEPKWEWEIKPQQKWFQLHLGELFNYKDLTISFLRRELLSGHHQTIIGLFWIILQPILTTVFYFFVFSRALKIPTANIPPVLFYMSGVIIWTFFSDCLNGTMYSFLHNAHILSKVYFPRLIVPLSMILNHTLRFGIQFVLFLIVYVLYSIFYQHIFPSPYIFLFPLLIIQIAAFSSGIGFIFSVYVARYRDIEYFMNFLLRLFMFITPVMYPASVMDGMAPQYRLLFWLNPLTPVIETFRTFFFDTGVIHYKYLLLSTVSTFFILAVGVVVFKKKEIAVMDTI